MKAMQMKPLLHESLEDCRTFWLDYIDVCRKLIQVLPQTNEGIEVKRTQHAIIKETFTALKKMQKDFK